MNKSRVARDLWRKVFNDNLIDLKDSDARKQVVREFLNDPVNKKDVIMEKIKIKKQRLLIELKELKNNG